MRRKLAILFLTLLISGCAVSGQSIRPTPDVIKSYDVGQSYQATTGSTMLTAGRAFTLPTYSPIKRMEPATLGVQGSTAPPLTPNQKWRAIIKTDDGYVLKPPPSYRLSDTHTIHIKNNGEVGRGWGSGSTNSSVVEGTWPEGKVFEKVEAVPMEGSFEFELLYTGMEGNNINMVYREYLDGMQRADFSQDLTYDLAESDTISFKSLNIRIEEATNSRVEYEVLSDGNLPWLPQR